jgi:methyl-accepting chemotaxis protein
MQFSIPLSLPQLLTPAVCSGAMLVGFLLFIYFYVKTGDGLHLTMMFLGLFGFVFVASETMILSIGGWLHNHDLAVQFHRSEQLAGTFFLFGLPFFLYHILELTPSWKGVNRIITWVGLGIALIITLAAFIHPDLFISMTKMRPTAMEKAGDYGRGVEGPFYMLRDAVLGLMIVYGIVIFIIDMIMHKSIRYLVFPFIGLLLAIQGAAVDIIHVHTGIHFDPFPGSNHSRFAVGITLMILFSMGSVIRQFIDAAREVERARRRALKESERSNRQNDFIKNVLQSSTDKLVSSTEEINRSIVEFTENTQNQAAATEEVTASIEEITAGIYSIQQNAGEQNQEVDKLADSVEGLAAIIDSMEQVVGDARKMAVQVAGNARSGEERLSIMTDSMTKIDESSNQMTGILKMINDISDQINLLALNASIEAARAGESGRGFAVVADEVSKLADQTASSLKEINTLIHTSEDEIRNGTENVSNAVEKIHAIIADIDGLSEMISRIAGYMEEQLTTSHGVSDSSHTVRDRSHEMLTTVREHKNTFVEISRTVDSINELAQRNSARIQEITDYSKELVSMMEKMRDSIAGFEDGSDEVTVETAPLHEKN